MIAVAVIFTIAFTVAIAEFFAGAHDLFKELGWLALFRPILWLFYVLAGYVALYIVGAAPGSEKVVDAQVLLLFLVLLPLVNVPLD